MQGEVTLKSPRKIREVVQVESRPKKEVAHTTTPKGKDKKEKFDGYRPLTNPRAQIFAMYEDDDK